MLQLLAGDDLQSTRQSWLPATSDKPCNLLHRSVLLRFYQKQRQQARKGPESEESILSKYLPGISAGAYTEL